MMDLFTIVEDASVILLDRRGFYRQANVYTRQQKFYAKVGSGFVKLARGGNTTVPAVRWIDHEGFQAP